MTRLLALLAALLAFAAPATAHEITFSSVTIRIGAEGTEIDVRLPIAGLLQQEPAVLPAGTMEADLRLAPLAPAVAGAVADLLTANLLVIGDQGPVALTMGGVATDGDDVAAVAMGAAPAGAITVSANLFPDDPLHKVFVELYRDGVLAGQYALDATSPGFTLAAAETQSLWAVIVEFVREGVRHIFVGPDHILFVIALILLGGRLRSQVKIITAFTIAHSITLTLATLDLVSLPSQLVESVIAASIVVVGLHDLWQLRRTGAPLAGWDPRPLFAFGFGLIHGFGFASVLGELGLPRESLGWALGAFNVGVEIGQLAIVLAATPILLAARRMFPPRVSRDLLSAVACAVIVVASVWLWQRAIG